MPQRPKNQRVIYRVGLVSCTLLLAFADSATVAQQRTSGDESRELPGATLLPPETAPLTDFQIPQLESSSVTAAALCFAVGFGACLLLIQCMLPALVHAQCVEIVREYTCHLRREPDVRVVVLDHELRESRTRPRRVRMPAVETVAEMSYDVQRHLRIDQPSIPTEIPTDPADDHGSATSSSMLSQIYEQNLHLRNQMRAQSRSVKQ